MHPNPGTTPNCGSLCRRRRRGEFVSPEQERMQESMKKYTKRNGLIFSNAMAVRQCPFCKSKWTTITIKHQQRTNERTDGPVAIQSSPQAKRMKRPVQGRPLSIIAKLAHIVAGLDRMSPAVEAGTTTQSKPTTNTIFAFSEWVAVNGDDAA